MNLITVFDCEGGNLAQLGIPAGVKMAGYITGFGAVPWTPAQFARHPDAIRIDQGPVNTPLNELADVLDVEKSAATVDDVPEWVRGARAAFHAGARPGQRQPLIYMSRDTVTPVANVLAAANITSGVGLWLAAPMLAADAAQLVTQASGPYPITGVQFAFNGDHDVSVFNADWFNNVSKAAPATPPKPGTQQGWAYCSKCKGLFFRLQEATSHCPLGGQHDGSASHNYDLPFAW